MSEPTPSQPSAPEYPVLALPADGVPPVVDTPDALAASREALRHGRGPLAIDTERAHGYRYSAKAYLIQVRREGAGTHLIDPVAFEDGCPRSDVHDFADELAETGNEGCLVALTPDGVEFGARGVRVASLGVGFA